MNECIKAICQEGYDLFQTGKAIMAKDSIAVIVPYLIKDGMDAPAVIQNMGSLKAEAMALISNPAADTDLLVFVGSLVAGESKKAQAVLSAAGQLVVHAIGDVEALVAAFGMPAEVAAPAAPAPASV